MFPNYYVIKGIGKSCKTVCSSKTYVCMFVHIQFNWVSSKLMLYRAWVWEFHYLIHTFDTILGGSRDYWFVLTSESLSWFKDEEVWLHYQKRVQWADPQYYLHSRRKTISSCCLWTSWSSETSSPPSCPGASCSPSTAPREGTCSRTSRWAPLLSTTNTFNTLTPHCFSDIGPIMRDTRWCGFLEGFLP